MFTVTDYRLFSYFKLYYNIVRMLDVKQIKLHECGLVLICQQDMFKQRMFYYQFARSKAH